MRHKPKQNDTGFTKRFKVSDQICVVISEEF